MSVLSFYYFLICIYRFTTSSMDYPNERAASVQKRIEQVIGQLLKAMLSCGNIEPSISGQQIAIERRYPNPGLNSGVECSPFPTATLLQRQKRLFLRLRPFLHGLRANGGATGGPFRSPVRHEGRGPLRRCTHAERGILRDSRSSFP